MLCQAQINLVEPFGNLCALGNSLVVKNDTINIVGTTCVDVGNNQFTLAGFVAEYDLNGTLQYYGQVGGTGRGYRAEKILIDSSNNKYILGTYSFDSLSNPINIGVFIQKRNSNNQILWTTEYRDSLPIAYYFMRDAALLDNGTIALSGAYNTDGPFEKDVLFMVFDSSGQVLVHKRIGTPGIQEEAKSMCVYSLNKIAIGANSFDPPNDKNWVLMIDYQGNVLDEYISASNRRIGVWDIVKTQDGGLACASAASNGNFSNYKLKSYVEKLDSNLNQVWSYVIDTAFRSTNLLTSIDETSNGDLIVGGDVEDFILNPDTTGFYGFLQKLSPSGDSIWYQSQYYYDNLKFSEGGHSIFDLQIYDDRIYFVGDANDFTNPIPPGQSMWLVSTDSNGIISSLNERVSNSQDILIYPNPARDQITFLLAKPKSARTIQVYDLQGGLFHQDEMNESSHALDISTWPSGMYIYRIQNEDGIFRGKFLKE